MPIIKSIKTQGGASLTWHRIARQAVGFLDAHNVAVLEVQSWPTIDDFVAQAGLAFTHQFTFTVPLVGLRGDSFLADCEQALINDPDGLLYGGSLAPLPTDLDMLKVLRWAQMKQMRDFAAALPIVVDGAVFDADSKSVDNVRGAIQGMEISGAATIAWTLFDNSVRVLTLDELRHVGAAIMARVDACYQQARELRLLIEAANTPEDVAAINWPPVVQTPALRSTLPNGEAPTQ